MSTTTTTPPQTWWQKLVAQAKAWTTLHVVYIVVAVVANVIGVVWHI